MTNGKTVNVKITRKELCDLLCACTTIRLAAMNRGTEETATKWGKIHDKLKEQLDAFDEKEANKA